MRNLCRRRGMQGLPHVMRRSVCAGCLIRSLHLLGIVIVPGYGGYSGDDTLHGRGISIVLVRGAVRLVVEIDHANHIVMIAG